MRQQKDSILKQTKRIRIQNTAERDGCSLSLASTSSIKCAENEAVNQMSVERPSLMSLTEVRLRAESAELRYTSVENQRRAAQLRKNKVAL